MNRLARLALLAYPRSFRREFGREYLQTIADLRNHGGQSSVGLAARLLIDASLTAPAMRWEHLMNSSKIILPVIAAVVAAFAILIGAPIAAFPLVAFVGVLAIAAHRHDQPIATEAADWGRLWYAWLIGAGILVLAGFAVLLTVGDSDLSNIAWATWILSWVAAAVAALVGLGLGAMHLRNHRRA